MGYSYSEQEENILKNHYPNAPKEGILRLLPHRTWSGLQQHATRKLKLRRGKYIPPLIQAEKLHLELSELEKVDLARMIDTDGHIGIYSNGGNGYYPRVAFTNTDRRLTNHFKKLCSPFGYSEIQRPPPKKGGRKRRFVARVDKMPQVYTLLKAIRPYLVAKYEQADLAMEYIEIRSKQLKKTIRLSPSKRQKEIVSKIHKLNRKGCTSEYQEG